MPKTRIKGKAQTVLGPVSPSDLGVTLMHEHLLLDITCYYVEPQEASRKAYRDAPFTIELLSRPEALYLHHLDASRVFDEGAATQEVLRYKHAGGQSLVDTTSKGIARDPLALARISRATGLNIIMGAGYYVPLAHPPDMDRKTEDEIGQEIVRDVTVGVGDTGVRSGVIGEIGNFWPLTENERKVLRAAGQAQAQTGAPITIHPGVHDTAHQEVLQILIGAGADPTHVIMGHLETTVQDMGSLKALAETGCFLEHDIFGWEDSSLTDASGIYMPNDVERMERLEFLVREGHADQLLISQDVCRKYHYTRYGGKGYAHILTNVVPRLRKRGFTDELLRSLLVENPARALAFR